MSGKTIRQLKKRIYDHLYYSQYAKMLTPVSRHLGLYHEFDTSVVKFINLEVVPQDPCGGKWDKRILQRETLWIERLGVTRAPESMRFYHTGPSFEGPVWQPLIREPPFCIALSIHLFFVMRYFSKDCHTCIITASLCSIFSLTIDILSVQVSYVFDQLFSS